MLKNGTRKKQHLPTFHIFLMLFGELFSYLSSISRLSSSLSKNTAARLLHCCSKEKDLIQVLEGQRSAVKICCRSLKVKDPLQGCHTLDLNTTLKVNMREVT